MKIAEIAPCKNCGKDVFIKLRQSDILEQTDNLCRYCGCKNGPEI